MKSDENFLRLFSIIAAIAALNFCMMSCNETPNDSGKKIYLSNCVVYDYNDNELLIKSGDSAILSDENYLTINNSQIKVDDSFVKKYCHEDETEINNKISLIHNKEGNGEYVQLEKDREFENKCLGKDSKGNITFCGAKFECFQVDREPCSNHSRPLLILGSSTYHPLSSVKATDMPFIKIDEKNLPVYPKEFFIYNDSLYVRFPKDDTLSIRIYYGLQTKAVKDLTADGNLHVIPVVNGADTFRIACPKRLSYLICANRPNSELVVFNDKTVTKAEPLKCELNTNSQKYPWYIWLCIIIVMIEFVMLLFVIIRKLASSKIIKGFIKKYFSQTGQRIEIKRFMLPDKHPLSRVKFIARKIDSKGISKKVMLCGIVQIQKKNALNYIEYLFENYYPKKDQALLKYLEDQTRFSDQSEKLDTVTLNVPLYIEDYFENDSVDKWVKNKKLGGYRKSLPSIDVTNSDVQQDNSNNVIVFDLQDSDSQKANSWERLLDTISKMSELVPEELKQMTSDIRDYVDGIRKEQEDFINAMRQSLKNASDNLYKQENLLSSEQAKNKQLDSELEKLQHDFNDKLKEKVATVKDELNKTREELDVTSRNLIETNSQFETLRNEHKKKEKDYHELLQQKKVVDKELSGIKNEHKKEVERIERQHKDILERAEQSFKASLKHQQEEFERTMSDYVRLYRRYGGCEPYTNYAKQFFDLLSQLQQGQMELSNIVSARAIDDAEKDNFNYYFTAVSNKFSRAIKGLKIDEYRKELVDLDETGMTRTGKVVDQILKTSSQEKYVDDLRYRIYEDLFRHLCGAAIVLSDDLESLQSLCPQAVSSADVIPFPKLTEQLLKVTRNMGYKPVYVKLFTSYSDYADISVEKTVNLEGTKKNDVTEVLSMAVNYGTHNDKTKVSANI